MALPFGRIVAIGLGILSLTGLSAYADPASGLVGIAPTPASTEASAKVLIPEGTEFQVRFDEKLSSGTATEGDRFSITTDDSITLANGVVIPAGYRGTGEVTAAKRKGMMGQGGQLSVRLDYVRIGEAKVHLRASQGKQGDNAMGATVALTLLFGPIGLLKHGHDIEIASGQKITAYVDGDTYVALPLAKPPQPE